MVARDCLQQQVAIGKLQDFDALCAERIPNDWDQHGFSLMPNVPNTQADRVDRFLEWWRGPPGAWSRVHSPVCSSEGSCENSVRTSFFAYCIFFLSFLLYLACHARVCSISSCAGWFEHVCWWGPGVRLILFGDVFVFAARTSCPRQDCRSLTLLVSGPDLEV